MSTIPPTANAPQVVRITSVKAVLARLNLKISIDDILKDIQEEEQANISLTVLSGFSLQSIDTFPAVGKATLIPNTTEPTDPDPSTSRRHNLLLKLAEETFPGGEVPDPFLSYSWLKSPRDDPSASKLPFIRASRIVVKKAGDASANAPQCIMEDVYCLWDTGAQGSHIITNQLPSEVRGNQDEGVALMSIDFENVNTTIDAFIWFRPQLPNGTTFIILGQSSLLSRLQYTIQPVDAHPYPDRVLQTFPHAYGQISLFSWRNPEGDLIFF